MHAALANVRPAFWLMLLLVAIGSVGMKLLAAKLASQQNANVHAAVYRYPADAMPECEQLLGLTRRLAQRGDTDAVWARLQASPLGDGAGGAYAVRGACRMSEPQAM